MAAATSAARATGMTVSWPVLRVCRDVDLDAVQLVESAPARASTAVGPAASTRPRCSSTSSRQRPAAKFRSCVETTIVRLRSRFSLSKNRADLELIREIERGRRLVEQAECRDSAPRRARDDDALFFAAGQRVEQPRLRDGACRLRARPRARSRDPRALRSRTRQGADSGPSSPSRAPCTRTRAASPAAPSPSAARRSREESSRRSTPSSMTRPSEGRSKPPAVEAASSCPSRSDRECRRGRRARWRSRHHPARRSRPRERVAPAARR